LWKDTLALAEDYLSLCSASTQPAPPPPSESAGAMRRLARDMERQHYARFHSLAQTFLRQCGSYPCASLRKVMEELVGDGQLNWGRVVSLFTFTGVLARQLSEKEGGANQGLPSRTSELEAAGGSCRGLAETIADYLGEEKKDWLLENGGWVSVRHSDSTPMHNGCLSMLHQNGNTIDLVLTYPFYGRVTDWTGQQNVIC